MQTTMVTPDRPTGFATPSPRQPANLVLPLDSVYAYSVETKVSPRGGTRISMQSAESFGEETMAAFEKQVKQQKEVQRRKIHKGHAMPVQTMASMPVQTMTMGMVPMSLPAMSVQPVVVDDEVVEEVDVTVVEDQTKEVLESLRHIWDAKIAQRDAQWQSVIQEMQARMSVLSMHTHSQDSGFQCENARLKQQIVKLEETIGVLEQDNGELSKIRIELKAKCDGSDGREAKLKKLLKELTEQHARLKKDYERSEEEKLELYRSVAEKKEESVEWFLEAEVEAIRKRNVELTGKASMLEADLDGAQVQIERLQGIISLLQVKLAERDDLRVQAAFSSEVVFSEYSEPRVAAGEEVSELEVEKRIETQVKERVSDRVSKEIRETVLKVEKKEQEIIHLKAQLEQVKYIEEKHHREIQLLREEHMRELEKVKKSYKYLDDVIRVDPAAYESRQHARYWSPRGGGRPATETVQISSASPRETVEFSSVSVADEANKMKTSLQRETKDALRAMSMRNTSGFRRSHN